MYDPNISLFESTKMTVCLFSARHWIRYYPPRAYQRNGDQKEHLALRAAEASPFTLPWHAALSYVPEGQSQKK
jgi:hypothetical protein